MEVEVRKILQANPEYVYILQKIGYDVDGFILILQEIQAKAKLGEQYRKEIIREIKEICYEISVNFIGTVENINLLRDAFSEAFVEMIFNQDKLRQIYLDLSQKVEDIRSKTEDRGLEHGILLDPTGIPYPNTRPEYDD